MLLLKLFKTFKEKYMSVEFAILNTWSEEEIELHSFKRERTRAILAATPFEDGVVLSFKTGARIERQEDVPESIEKPLEPLYKRIKKRK